MRLESSPERWAFLPAVALAIRPGVASLRGQVRWTGPVPPPAAEHRESDSYCRAFAAADDRPPLVSLDYGVRDAVVWLAPLAAPPRAPSWKSALVSFEKCSLSPRVQVASVGQVLEVVNRDGTLHSVRAHLGAVTVFNKSLRDAGAIPDEAQSTLEQPGIYTIRCDLHPWERATVVVTSAAPAQLTSMDGNFNFDEIPPGLYTLGAWEEKAGISARRIELPGGESKAVLQLNQSFLARR